MIGLRLLKSGELTLLVEEVNASLNVTLVQWTKSRLSTGRVINLDENNAIICPVNFVTPRSFPDVDIILPVIGECARRVRKPNRPAVPPFAWRLMQMFTQAISQHSCADHQFGFDAENSCEASHATCMICSLGSTADMMTCAYCLQSVHQACCSRLFASSKFSMMQLRKLSGALTYSMIPSLLLAEHTDKPSGSATSSSTSSEIKSAWGSQLGFAA